MHAMAPSSRAIDSWTTSYMNTLSKRQMESLTAACDTLLPSVDVSGTGDDALISFYGTSASMAGTTELLGGLVSGGVQHPAMGMLRLALWLLSTPLGTLAMCGSASLSNRFPYLHKFSEVTQEKREKIILSWAFSCFFLYRMMFKCLKYLTVRVHFGQVNHHHKDKMMNPTWKALDYCGPDPDFAHVRRQQYHDDDECPGPLHSSLLRIDASTPRETTFHKLQMTGFPLPTNSNSNLPSYSSPLTLRCDAVIIGSGSGGSVVAGVLATAGYKVLVIEKGNYYARSDLSLLEGPTSAAMYEGGGIIATDNVETLFLAGATVGGGSTINWSASIRTPNHVRKEWCDEHGLELFGSKAYDHSLDVVCDRMGVQSDVLREGFNNEVLRKGCLELGFPVSSVPCNAPPDHYCGWCHLGCKDGRKKSTQETWLADLDASGNGLILTGCKALKVLLHKHKQGTTDRIRSVAKGVVVESENNKEVFVVESKVTVVACGALNTPGLLKRSGLRNKNIGKNLHVHPCVMAWGYFPPPGGGGGGGGWPEKGKRSYEGGILTAMSTVEADFHGSGYGAILQTPALHPSMFATITPWVSASDFRERMGRFSRTAHIFALARDRGSGTVDYPRTLTYELDGCDERSLRRGMEATLRVLVAAGAEEVGTQQGDGERFRVKGKVKGKGVDEEEEEEFEAFLKRVSERGPKTAPISSAHQMGSCRMGIDPYVSAVSPKGETWEVEGLFVADTSVFPTALGVNPMVTVQAIAHCTAQSILQLLHSKSSAQHT